MHAITESLEREAVDWVVSLNAEGALELGNVDTFMENLQARFRDPSQTLRAEGEICTTPGTRLVAEYIREF